MESSQHPLDAIAGNKVVSAVTEQSTPPESTHSEVHDQLHNAGKESSPASKSVRPAAHIPHALNLSGLKSPAIILDGSMQTIWQNEMAIDQIWQQSHAANNGNPTPDIFDLLFDQQYQLAVDNWRQWVSFFTQQVTGFIPAEALENRIGQMNPRQRELVSSIVAGQKDRHGQKSPLDSCLRQVLTNGAIRSFNTMTIDFNEGRLMVFVPIGDGEAPAANLHTHDILRRYDFVRRHPNPIKVGFSVLSAFLNNSTSLKTELLSDEYCRLVNDLCRMCIDTIEQFGGYFLKHSDSGLGTFFLPADEYSEDTAINAIRCALALKAEMPDLSRKWKLRKCWLNDIELNIGIHYDIEHIGILTSALGDCLTSFGSALGTATGLAHMSHDGQIWATKSLINGMPEKVRKQIRFGIHRQKVLVQNSFAKLQDLPGSSDLAGESCKELETMAVTQIFDLQATE